MSSFAYLQLGDLVRDEWITKLKVYGTNWTGPAHFHIEGVLVGETTLFSLQHMCLDELNHDTYRIVDKNQNVFTIDARLMQVECNTADTLVRLLLFLNSSSPQQHPRLWSPLVCFHDKCLRPPHESHMPHSYVPEAA